MNRVTLTDSNPPIGGANLECILSCTDLPARRLQVLAEISIRHGFTFVEGEALLAYYDDMIVPGQIALGDKLTEFLEETEQRGVRRCIANFTGTLVDTATPMSIVLDFENKVVVMSVPEDVIWGFGADTSRADFRRLETFATFCHNVCSEVSPVFGYFGTESLHPEDMKLDRAAQAGASRVDDSFFSETRLRDLFNWYVDTYTKRWLE